MDTAPIVLLFVFFGIPIIFFGIQGFFRIYYKRKKEEILRHGFPKSWLEIIRRNVPIALKLPPEFQDQLRENVQLFIAETHFEGQGGIEIDEEIQVTVATQACLLTAGRKRKRYPRLKTVIIYPSAFTDGKDAPSRDDDLPAYRLGESWTTGTVILAWDSTRRGAKNIYDGKNVTLHEFAHQLDQEDGVGDGAPIFDSQSAFAAWAGVFAEEYKTQVKKATKGHKSVIDHYGATNYAEFFAVSTEAFFEKPKQLKRKRPELYDILKHYYKLDPVQWR